MVQEAGKMSDAFTSARNLIQEYFDSWKGTDEGRILAWYSDDVRLWLPTGLLEGKAAVREQFVRPFIHAFPGNVHEIQRLVYGDNVVAVEWRFKAEHSGKFQGIPATGRKTDVPGCSIYSLRDGVITAGNIYFNVATLLEQIGVAT
jgi:steroid delta-isomerase-like uncharacterized protein